MAEGGESVGVVDRANEFLDRGTVRRHGRELVLSTVRRVQENDLLSYASAIAFQVAFALLPLALATLAVLALLNLEEWWTQELAPEVEARVEQDAYSVIERTVDSVLSDRRFNWLTFGILFTIWQISGAVRATMLPLNRIYQSDEERPGWKRFLISIVLSVALAPLALVAIGLIQLGPRVAEQLDFAPALRVAFFFGRWGISVALLLLAAWLVIRYAPAKAPPFRWTGLGAVFVVAAWIGASLVFGWYATVIADYTTLFGSLAVVIVLLVYIYVSAGAFLFAAQLDACVREMAREGEGDGEG
jgi:membrane protein